MLSEKEKIKILDGILLSSPNTEKHRRYHIFPERVSALVKDRRNSPKSRFYEKERLEFIKSRVNFKNKMVLDIGCNTGYFLFAALDNGASKVIGYEGETTCHEFLENAVMLLDERDKFSLFKQYYDFRAEAGKYDIIILLNVLHHIGDDYGSKTMTMDVAKGKIVEQINSLSRNTSVLIIQMGFNWKGHINTCLFDHGTKEELIAYIEDGTKENWEISAIGIAEAHNGRILYNLVNDKNILRDDSLGEFLNRPLFILKSKNVEKD